MCQECTGCEISSPEREIQKAKAYAGSATMADPHQPSTLGQLLDAQEKTAALLNVLAEKLQCVASPHPVESEDRLNGGYHINASLGKQHDINDALAYIIDTLVV
jgi:hypothetical protein